VHVTASERDDAWLALDYVVEHLLRELAGMAAALDALIFTGGIAKNAAALRTRVIAGRAWLGCPSTPTRTPPRPMRPRASAAPTRHTARLA
jgi:acetate kinase